MRNDPSNSVRSDDAAHDKLEREIAIGGISDYAAPEMVSLGASKNLIQGLNWQGYGDFSVSYYTSG
jgi:hypothetical protein